MIITAEFITGMKVGIEFPGDGLYFVLDFLIVRIVGFNPEMEEE